MFLYIDLDIQLELCKLQLLIKSEGRLLGQWLDWICFSISNLEWKLTIGYGPNCEENVHTFRFISNLIS